MDAEAGESMRFLQRRFERIVRLTIGEHDQHAIGDFGTGMQQVDALLQRGGQRRPPFRGNIRIERVEIQHQGRAVDRQRRQDVARSGKCRETEPVAVEILNETPRLAQRPRHPAGLRVFGQHGS